MFTKQDFCLMLIDEWVEGGEVLEEQDIYNSSKLAVALEYLGKLTTEENKIYARSRDGIMYVSRTKIMSVREFLNLLPEEEETPSKKRQNTVKTLILQNFKRV